MSPSSLFTNDDGWTVVEVPRFDKVIDDLIEEFFLFTSCFIYCKDVLLCVVITLKKDNMRLEKKNISGTIYTTQIKNSIAGKITWIFLVDFHEKKVSTNETINVNDKYNFLKENHCCTLHSSLYIE